MEAMGKLIKLKVLIIGCRGLGVEIAKNLILAGPASVTLYDPHLVTWGDLSANFYCRPEHVGQLTRAEASILKLPELNPYVRVNIINTLAIEDLAHYSLVCDTQTINGESFESTLEANEFCRDRNIGYISTQIFGPWGYAFVDYGNEFSVFDIDGEETKSFIVANITQANPAIVTVHEDKRHKFQDGDFVQFREVQGMEELNALGPILIDVIDGFSFKLRLDTTGFQAYQRQGLVENVKVPKKIAFHSMR